MCKTKDEFNELCTRLQNDIISNSSQPLFEITQTSQIPYKSSSGFATRAPQSLHPNHSSPQGSHVSRAEGGGGVSPRRNQDESEESEFEFIV